MVETFAMVEIGSMNSTIAKVDERECLCGEPFARLIIVKDNL